MPSDRRGVVVDALFGFAVFAVVAIAVASDVSDTGNLPLGYGVAGVLGALMLVRRRWPIAVLVATSVLVVANYVLQLPVIGLAVPVAAALYSAAEAGRTLWSVGLAAALVLVSTFTRLQQGQDPAYLLGYELPTTVAVMGAATALGHVQWQRRRAEHQRVRIEVLDRQARESEAAERLALERTRIARDLHDAVGHHLSVVSLHAAVAVEALDDDPADVPVARAELDHVARASRAGLSELRATVRALREADPGGDRVSSLAHLDELVATVRAAGVDVEVTGVPAPGEVPGMVDATAYRIVQEALTNTLRHARAPRARVAFSRRDGMLDVTVTDEGTAVPVASPGGSGLAGMRERVRLVGGSVEAAPRPGGGFGVRALLPLGDDR
ncbi:sensor histidine kinase [Nocardiopsis dassonvillei]|jgi:signal transduction histidine kinase|uniref:sensor histidine kinase n=1 Tax=Nocardiopsis dassonvillei TaxID=2014 RepID=UPI000B9D551B|nr:sensor histidine kinase [Nocardiopsis dassonvillei]ASU61139.1 two-component sensor histidine kinase [Nocardiopsis dassonvillei]